MASIKIPAIIIPVALALLTCLTTAREWYDLEHLAPVSAPASSPDYAPLSVDVSVGGSEQTMATHQSKLDCVPSGGASGGSSGYGGGSAGSGMPGGWGGGMGGSTGMGWTPMTGGRMKNGAAGTSSSVTGFLAFLAVLLASGVMYL